MTLVPAFFIPRFFAAGGAPAAELTSGQSWAVVLVLAAAAAAAAGWRFWRDRGLRWAPARPVSTLLLLFVAFDNIPRLLAGNPWSPVLLAALAAWQLFLDAAFGLLWHDRGRGGFWRAWAAEAAFLPGAAWIGLHAFRGISSDSAALAVLIHLGAFAVGIGLLRWTGRRWPTTSAERARWGLVALASLALAHPWLSPYLVGTGDAKLYAETLQDFLAQWHAGIRPPLVSQSEVAPFGAVFPFRFATYHYYFAAAIDALTGGNLTVYAVQHVTIVLSFLGGGGAMYLVLRRVCPRHPGVAGLLAVLYVASPAWLGPLYAMTMIFTVMALPFVPLALGGAWHCLGASSKSRAVAHGAALAAAWHAHPPVGCWVSGMTLLGQGVGLCVDRTAWRALGRQALAWGVCALLCCGLWYSAAEVQPPGAVREEMSTMLASIVKSSFPGSILPAQQPPAGLRDLQLGYSLAAVLVLAAVAAGFGLRRTFIWLLPAVCLLVLTLPVPWLTLHFWQLVPRTIQGITGVWVVQRLLPVLAGTVALAGGAAAAVLGGRLRPPRVALVIAAAGLLAWSGWEARKYVARGHVTEQTPALNRWLNRPENSPILINWLAFLPYDIPSVYRGTGFVDARLFNEVWSNDRKRILVGNYSSLLEAARREPAIQTSATPIQPDVLRLLPYFMFKTGQRYLLELQPTARTLPGAFIMSSTDFQRVETRLVPNGPTIVTPFWSSAPDNLPMEMVFEPAPSAMPHEVVPDFLRYRLIPYEPGKLPIRILHYAPYEAKMELAEPGWLETHRMFVKGYEATVNGRSVPVSMSADFRAMVPVPAGKVTVRLNFRGNAFLRAGYAVMAIGWILVALWGVFAAARALLRRSAAAAGPTA